jgi:hypothetical protein
VELGDRRPTGHRHRVSDLERVCTKVVITIVGLETLNEFVFAASDSSATLRKLDLQKDHCPLAEGITHSCSLDEPNPRFLFDH